MDNLFIVFQCLEAVWVAVLLPTFLYQIYLTSKFVYPNYDPQTPARRNTQIDLNAPTPHTPRPPSTESHELSAGGKDARSSKQDTCGQPAPIDKTQSPGVHSSVTQDAGGVKKKESLPMMTKWFLNGGCLCAFLTLIFVVDPMIWRIYPSWLCRSLATFTETLILVIGTRFIIGLYSVVQEKQSLKCGIMCMDIFAVVSVLFIFSFVIGAEITDLKLYRSITKVWILFATFLCSIIVLKLVYEVHKRLQCVQGMKMSVEFKERLQKKWTKLRIMALCFFIVPFCRSCIGAKSVFVQLREPGSHLRINGDHLDEFTFSKDANSPIFRLLMITIMLWFVWKNPRKFR